MTDKSSSSFARYLAKGSFADRFGPLPSTISKVRTVLRADGLDVTGISSDGLFVGFKGSAQLVERAFHTGLESYRLPDGSPRLRRHNGRPAAVFDRSLRDRGPWASTTSSTRRP